MPDLDPQPRWCHGFLGWRARWLNYLRRFENAQACLDLHSLSSYSGQTQGRTLTNPNLLSLAQTILAHRVRNYPEVSTFTRPVPAFKSATTSCGLAIGQLQHKRCRRDNELTQMYSTLYRFTLLRNQPLAPQKSTTTTGLVGEQQRHKESCGPIYAEQSSFTWPICAPQERHHKMQTGGWTVVEQTLQTRQ